jgi:hypothetical protein
VIAVTAVFDRQLINFLAMAMQFYEQTASKREQSVRQRAQRRGLSLRKMRSTKGAAGSTPYWLVSAPENSIIAGGDTGLPLEEIAALLSMPLSIAAAVAP